MENTKTIRKKYQKIKTCKKKNQKLPSRYKNNEFLKIVKIRIITGKKNQNYLKSSKSNKILTKNTGKKFQYYDEKQN